MLRNNPGMTWKVNGITGGDSTVAIAAKGLYAAPAIITDSHSVKVTATSIVVPSVAALARVTFDNPLAMLAAYR